MTNHNKKNLWIGLIIFIVCAIIFAIIIYFSRQEKRQSNDNYDNISIENADITNYNMLIDKRDQLKNHPFPDASSYNQLCNEDLSNAITNLNVRYNIDVFSYGRGYDIHTIGKLEKK